MTPWRLLLANLRYFRAANIAVAAGVAVATAVLAGALMVGDSVRGSLADMAERRLGPVTHAVTSPRPFPASLAKRLDDSVGEIEWCKPVIITRGSATTGDESIATGGVRIIGAEADLVDVRPGHCVVNALLARILEVGPGDAVLLNVPLTGQLSADAALSRRDRGSHLTSMRLTIQRVADESGFEADFALTATQRTEPGAWVHLADLQRSLGRPGQANTILIAYPGHDESFPMSRDTIPIWWRLARIIEPNDYGLSLEPVGDGRAALVSTATYLPPAAEEALPTTIAANRVLVNLAATVSAGPRAVRYAVVAGLSAPPGGDLAPDEIAINAWTAEQLTAQVGDRLTLSWFDRGGDGAVVETSDDGDGGEVSFRIARIVPMTGLGADPSLTPVFEGLTDAATVAEWDPPEDLPIDLDLVTEADEQYWGAHKAAPKLFISLAAAQHLWGQPYGQLTSVRVASADAPAVAAALRDGLRPRAMGLVVQSVRDDQMAAATGSTDFAQLYLSLSLFLIAAAAGLVALLMRLSVEQRARQLGLMAAVGFTPRSIRRLALAEGLLVATVGAVIGLAVAPLYTGGIMAGLRTWWYGAVGTEALGLHVRPLSVLIGGTAGLIVAAMAIVWATRRIGRTPAAALLAGRWETRAMQPGRTAYRSIVIAIIAAAAGIAIGVSARHEAVNTTVGILGGGALLTIAVLATLNCAIRPRRDGRNRIKGRSALGRLANANAGRRPTRTMLAASLLAFTTFILMVLSVFQVAAPADTHELSSGAGGFTVIARPDIPLPTSPTSAAARRLIGIPNADDAAWDSATFVAMRRRGGQDASCLNITRPTDPTILSVPPDAMTGRFRFARRSAFEGSPWDQLRRLQPDDAIAVITDEATARWILKIAPGDTLTVTDHQGRPRQLVLIATLTGSIFQSELLMDEGSFRKLFPAATGVGTLLAATDPADTPAVLTAMSTGLTDYGMSVEPTARLLERLAEVSNTYLSTFQILGYLGLLGGLIGLSVVTVRSILERRGELALLTALGFSPRRREQLLNKEAVTVLNGGVGSGAAGAVIAMVLAQPAGRPINLTALVIAFGCILLAGWAAQFAAITIVGRRIGPADLRHE